MMTLLTKDQIVGKNLVTFTPSHKSIASNTLIIANELGRRHGDVTKKVTYLLKNGRIDRRDFSSIYYKDSYNRDQKYYQLNEKATLQTVMGFTGLQAEKLHERIAIAFILMRDNLEGWESGRITSKSSTKLANKVIQQLGEDLKAELPLSRKGSFVYKHIQEQINNVILGSCKSVERSELSSSQLHRITVLESVVTLNISVLRSNGVSAEKTRERVIEDLKKRNRVNNSKAVVHEG